VSSGSEASEGDNLINAVALGEMSEALFPVDAVEGRPAREGHLFHHSLNVALRLVSPDGELVRDVVAPVAKVHANTVERCA
jgi:hypothetical protein